ncbi:MAG: hypothetical protein Q8R37_05385 [Nanoarchaeota archaeon]|nr:hypothetical protein [Nanoarchaeota archaeon]
MSERFIPEEYKSGKLVYITTIAAAGGNLEDLITNLEHFKLLIEGKRVGITPTFSCYLAQQSEKGVSFDMYAQKSGKDTRTTTAKFRSELGELLTMLLQTGYTISTVEISTLKRNSQYHPFKLPSSEDNE